MGVRAKFIVDSKSVTRHGTSVVNLSPVISGSEENKQFWTYTPSGRIELQITNPQAVDAFEVGKEYYVDFTPAAIEKVGE